jgi:hypothetical protein
MAPLRSTTREQSPDSPPPRQRTERHPYSRHGLNAAMVRVKLRGFKAIDRRMAAAREAFAFRSELVSALGGDADLSPQRRRLIDMAVRAALLLDHVDAWLFEQQCLVNQRTRTLLPVLSQRQSIADHLARLLDRLGLDRVPQRVQALHDVLAEIAAQREASARPVPDTHQDQEPAQ